MVNKRIFLLCLLTFGGCNTVVKNRINRTILINRIFNRDTDFYNSTDHPNIDHLDITHYPAPAAFDALENANNANYSDSANSSAEASKHAVDIARYAQNFSKSSSDIAKSTAQKINSHIVNNVDVPSIFTINDLVSTDHLAKASEEYAAIAMSYANKAAHYATEANNWANQANDPNNAASVAPADCSASAAASAASRDTTDSVRTAVGIRDCAIRHSIPHNLDHTTVSSRNIFINRDTVSKEINHILPKLRSTVHRVKLSFDKAYASASEDCKHIHISSIFSDDAVNAAANLMRDQKLHFHSAADAFIATKKAKIKVDAATTSAYHSYDIVSGARNVVTRTTSAATRYPSADIQYHIDVVKNASNETRYLTEDAFRATETASKNTRDIISRTIAVSSTDPNFRKVLGLMDLFHLRAKDLDRYTNDLNRNEKLAKNLYDSARLAAATAHRITNAIKFPYATRLAVKNAARATDLRNKVASIRKDIDKTKSNKDDIEYRVNAAMQNYVNSIISATESSINLTNIINRNTGTAKEYAILFDNYTKDVLDYHKKACDESGHANYYTLLKDSFITKISINERTYNISRHTHNAINAARAAFYASSAASICNVNNPTFHTTAATYAAAYATRAAKFAILSADSAVFSDIYSRILLFDLYNIQNYMLIISKLKYSGLKK